MYFIYPLNMDPFTGLSAFLFGGLLGTIAHRITHPESRLIKEADAMWWRNASDEEKRFKLMHPFGFKDGRMTTYELDKQRNDK